MIQILNKLSTEGMFLNIIKTAHDKSTANIIFNSENLKAFPVRSKTTQRCAFLFDKVLEVLAIASSQRRKISKGNQSLKKEVKETVCVFIQHDATYRKS